MSTLNVGIMGCGHIAQKMALTLNKTRGFRAYAAASRDIDKAVGFCHRHHVKKAYGSYAQMLQDKKVDLVYIATPNSEHAANARMCIEAGKPCLIEKPFAISEAQAREVFALAEARNVFVTEAIWTRYMPFVQTMREVLTSGVIGDPVMLTANLGYPVKSRPRMTDPELGGGTLLDLGIYPINFASMLFGDDILRVEATCSYTPQRLDEQDNITFVYRDGRAAALSASMLGAADRRGMVSGTKGYLVIENINNFEEMTVYNADHGKITTYRRVRQKTGYEYELQACKMALSNHWLECPEMTHAETLFMLHIMDDIRGQLGIIYPCEVMHRVQASAPSASATWQDESAAPMEEAEAMSAPATRQDDKEAEALDASAACRDDKGAEALGSPAACRDDKGAEALGSPAACRDDEGVEALGSPAACRDDEKVETMNSPTTRKGPEGAMSALTARQDHANAAAVDAASAPPVPEKVSSPTGQDISEAPDEKSQEFSGFSGETVSESGTGGRVAEDHMPYAAEGHMPDPKRDHITCAEKDHTACTEKDHITCAEKGHISCAEKDHIPGPEKNYLPEETVYVPASYISQERVASVEDSAERQTLDFTDETSEN